MPDAPPDRPEDMAPEPESRNPGLAAEPSTTPTPETPSDAPSPAAADSEPAAVEVAEPPPAPRRSPWGAALAERPEEVVERPLGRLRGQSRRDFLVFTAGVVASAVGAFWLLPDRTRARLLP